MFTVGDWLTILGGSSAQHEWLVAALADTSTTPDEPSIEVLVRSLGARLVYVHCTSEAMRLTLSEAARSQNTYAIAILAQLELVQYRSVLVLGAAGVVWAGSSPSRLVDVTRAALEHDVLLPKPVLNALIPSENDQRSDLSEASQDILMCLSEGLSVREMVERLNFNTRTVQRRIVNLCLHLGATTPAQAVHIAHRSGLIH